jgi:hypothetical protein
MRAFPQDHVFFCDQRRTYGSLHRPGILRSVILSFVIFNFQISNYEKLNGSLVAGESHCWSGSNLKHLQLLAPRTCGAGTKKFNRPWWSAAIRTGQDSETVLVVQSAFTQDFSLPG